MKLAIFITALLFSTMAIAGDPRYSEGPILRNADGTIHRSAAAIREFRSWHPCPSTGLATGACPGWAIDHTIPLKCGGLDVPWNMQWLTVQIKSCAGKYCKDRFELKIYCKKHLRDAPQPAPFVVDNSAASVDASTVSP